MAKLYFSYAAMNAGKTTILLQASHNYRERGMNTIFSRPGSTTGSAKGRSAADRARGGGFRVRRGHRHDFADRAQNDAAPLACVLVDEAQFLSDAQVWQLAAVADDMGIPVMCYGLRTDFEGNLFPEAPGFLPSRTCFARSAPSAIADARPRWWFARPKAARSYAGRADRDWRQ